MTTRGLSPDPLAAGSGCVNPDPERYGALGPESALAVLRESLTGLARRAPSAGPVHQDFRPENVLIDRHGGSALTRLRRSPPQRAGPAAAGRAQAGPDPYQAPELRYGAPVSWASNVYAATAVFFECLTGSAPSPERMRQFERQQLAAPGPAGQSGGPLRDLLAWGMAASPAGRPASARHILAELDDLAAACYGPDWYRRGRWELGERVAGALARGNGAAGNTGRISRRGSRPGHRRARRPGLVAGIATVTAAAVLGLAGTAVALSGHFGSKPSGSGQGASSGSASSSSTAGASTVKLSEPGGGKAAFTADATVTPAATTSTCATPATFTVSGTVSATAAGTVTYQWFGSSRMTGQVQTLHFSGAGTKRVTGTPVRSKTAGTGWAAIKTVSPKAATSNRATYILDCSDGPVTVSATAAVTPASRTVSCAAAPPSATFSGTIHDAKAGTVTYYWELPTGNGPTRSLTFSSPGTEPAAPATVTAASDSSTESGTLVVLSPAAVSSNTATFSVSCTQPAPGSSLAPTGSSGPSSSTAPATASASTLPPDVTVNLVANQPTPKTVACGSAPPGFEVMATFTSTQTTLTETYHWVRPDGTATAPGKINVNAASTSSASDLFTPTSDNFSGTETLVFTSPIQGSWSIPLALTCSATTSSPSPPQYYVQIFTPSAGGVEFGKIGAPFTTTFAAKYGTAPYTWSVTGLPPGLAIDAATGTVSGAPTTGGIYNNCRVTVTDSSSPAESYSVDFTFNIPDPPIVMSAPPLPDGTVGVPYPGVQFSATGGNGTYAWYLALGNEPPGLSMSLSGVLSGTPTTAGTYSVDVIVHSGVGDYEYVSESLTLVINPAQLPPEVPV